MLPNPENQTTTAEQNADRVVTPLAVTAGDIANLRHMVGAREDISPNKRGYRNHFAPSVQNIQSMERLVAAGLAHRGSAYQEMHYYHATEAGAAAAGLTPKQIHKLFSDY